VTPPSPFRLYRREIANAQYRNSASRLEAHRSLVERSAAATTEHRSQVIARVSAQKGEKGKWRYGEACRPGCRKAPPAMQERSRCLHTFRSSWKGRAHHVDVPWSFGPVPLRLHCSRGTAWSGRCRVSRFRPVSNRSSPGFRRRRGSACQRFVRIGAWGLHAFVWAYYGGRAVAEEGSISLPRDCRSRNRPSRTSSARPICDSCGAGRRSP
jgi:hypothetical protein